MTVPKPQNISVSDTVKATDKLDTYKKWFNGLKHFTTVKRLPPNK